MASSTPYNGFPFPEATDPDNVPADIEALALAIDSKAVMKFTSSGARDAAIGTPTNGMLTYLTDEDRFSWRENGSWRKGTFVGAGLDAARPSAASVPEGSVFYETNTNLLKATVGSSWVILNATGTVGGSDVNASAVAINGTEKLLHEITLPANPDYALEVFVNGYTTFGGGSSAEDVAISIRQGGLAGTLKAYGIDRAPSSGWGHVAISDTLTIAKGSSASDRKFSLTAIALSGGGSAGVAPRSNANATGIDYVAIPKNL